MRYVLTALMCLCLSWWTIAPAMADTVSAPAGGSHDWIRVSKDADWIEVTTPLAGFTYALPFDSLDASGMGFSFRGSDAEDFIQEYGVEYYDTVGPIKWFAGVKLDVWAKGYTGETEFPWGGRAGIRTDVGAIPFEASAHYATAGDGVEHRGLFFGLFITNDLDESQ